MAWRRARHRWPSYAGIALLLGLISGISLFAIAGARRTQSAYPRFLDAVHAPTLSVASTGGYSPKLSGALAGAPEVARSRTYVGFNTFVVEPGKPSLTTRDIEATGSFDGRFYDVDRFTATRGRAPDPARVDEFAVNEFAAQRFGLDVGRRVELETYDTSQITTPGFFEHPSPPKMRTQATLVGIGLFPEEVLQDDADRATRLLLTPAFSEMARPYATYASQGLILKHGDRDVDAIKQHIAPLAPAGTIEYQITSVSTFHAQQAVKPLTIALVLFGCIVGLAGLVLVFQSIARALRADREEQAILRALGASPRRLVATAVLAPAAAIVAGTALGAAIAIAASPAMPVGPVRKVEVARGFDVDATVMLVGAAIIVAILLACTVGVTWHNAPHRVARRPAAAAHSSRVAAVAAHSGMPAPAVEGLRFALERSGNAAASWSVIAGSVIAIAALTGAVVFGASLDTLVRKPHLYGWNGNAAIVAGNGYGNLPLDQARTILDSDPHVETWSGAVFGHDRIGDRDVPLLGMRPGGGLYPSILSGRAIASRDEIVLGPETAQQLHARIGSTVTLAGEQTPHTLRVVGTATFPTIGAAHVGRTSLGVGALVAPELVPGFDRDIQDVRRANLGPRAIFVRFTPSADIDAQVARLRTTTRPLAGFAGLDVVPVQRPVEIVNSSDVGAAPLLLAGALALGAVVSLTLALATSVRRRRRDLVVLKTLGFTRRQLAATLSWHATTTILIGVVIGIPLGAALGALAWKQFARQLDVVTSATVPIAVLLAVAALGVVIANLAAVLPGRAARRLDTAALLEAE
jgi:ABC-type lipoprotein release transport system permease subunit